MWIITSYNFMRWYTDKAAEVQMLQNLQKASKIVAVTVFKPGNRSKFLSVYLMLNQSDLWPPPPQSTKKVFEQVYSGLYTAKF